jgi:hypothetical protein
VKAFRLATEGHGPVVAQDAVFNSHYQPPIGGPTHCHLGRRPYKIPGGRRHARGDGRPRRSCSKDTIPISSRSRW